MLILRALTKLFFPVTKVDTFCVKGFYNRLYNNNNSQITIAFIRVNYDFLAKAIEKSKFALTVFFDLLWLPKVSLVDDMLKRRILIYHMAVQVALRRRNGLITSLFIAIRSLSFGICIFP